MDRQRLRVWWAFFIVWAIYMGTEFARQGQPPLPYWTIPGAMWTVLSGQIPGITRSKRPENGGGSE